MIERQVDLRPGDDSFIMPLLRYQNVRAEPSSACPTGSPLRRLLRRATTDGRGRPRRDGLCDRVYLWRTGDLLVRAPGGRRATASRLFGGGPQARDRRVVEREPVWPPRAAVDHRLKHAFLRPVANHPGLDADTGRDGTHGEETVGVAAWWPACLRRGSIAPDVIARPPHRRRRLRGVLVRAREHEVAHCPGLPESLHSHLTGRHLDGTHRDFAHHHPQQVLPLGMRGRRRAPHRREIRAQRQDPGAVVIGDLDPLAPPPDGRGRWPCSAGPPAARRTGHAPAEVAPGR